MKIVSCGLVVVSPQGWLLAHATNSGRWDLPKGRPDEGEMPLDTALREAWEETNLDFSALRGDMKDLGQHSYIPGKDLHLFRLDLPKAWALDDCKCHTFVEWQGGQRFPETDKWEWVPETDILNRVGKGLGNLLINAGLIANPGANWWKDRLHKKASQVAARMG